MSKLKNILRSIKTTNYQELGKAIEFAFNEVTERKYLELVYSLLLLYLMFMRKAINAHRSHLPIPSSNNCRSTIVAEWRSQIISIFNYKEQPAIPPNSVRSSPACA